MVSEAKILTEWHPPILQVQRSHQRLEPFGEKLERAGAIAGAGKVEPKYEVIYSEAECFYRLAQKNKSKDDGKDFAKTGPGSAHALRQPRCEDSRPRGNVQGDQTPKYFLLCGKLADYLGLPKPIRPRAVRKTK